MTSTYEERFFARLVSLADALATDFDVLETASSLVHDCAELLPVHDAGLMLVNEHSRLQVLASTSEETRILEFLELQSNEGPCLEAFTCGDVVEAPDLLYAAQRWPHFRTYALGLGFLSAYAVPLRMHGRTIGALNLFCTIDHGLGDRELLTAHRLATMATLGILTHRTVQRHETLSRQLQHALDTRVVVEQAKGMLAERAGVAMGVALELLRKAARSSRRPLVDVATDVVCGRLPADVSRPRFPRARQPRSV